MSLTATRRGGTFVLPPAGQHIARCYAVVDLGTQAVVWQNQTKYQPKAHIRFELCHEMMPADESGQARPFSVGLTVTNSTDPKAALRHHLESWAGRTMCHSEEVAFDLTKLLGKACQITVSHEKGKKDPSKTYAVIKAIVPLAKGMVAPELVNEKVAYAVEQGQDEVFLSLSEYLQETIANCEEWKPKTAAESGDEEAPAPAPEPPPEDENVPF